MGYALIRLQQTVLPGFPAFLFALTTLFFREDVMSQAFNPSTHEAEAGGF